MPSRKRGTVSGQYGHPALPGDHMIRWLAQAAQEARLKAGRLEVHIAAAVSRDQSTINRFEQGKAWPRDPDATIQAYADDLEIDPREIWARAMQLWIEQEKPSTERAADALRAAVGATRDPRRSPQQSADKRPSKAKRRASG